MPQDVGGELSPAMPGGGDASITAETGAAITGETNASATANTAAGMIELLGLSIGKPAESYQHPGGEHQPEQ